MKVKIIMLNLMMLFLSYTICQGQVKVIAHRGLSSLAPENTLEAFRQAIDLGVDLIELDVRTTKDDSLVVIHDATVDRTCKGSGYVEELLYEELRKFSAGFSMKFDERFPTERIPSLSEVLLLAKDRVKVCIEIKKANPVKVIRLVEELNMNEQVIIMSFNYNILSKARSYNKNIALVFLRTIGSDIDIQKAKNIDALGVAFYFANREMIKKAHLHDLELWRWTVNSPSKMAAMIDAGFDGIITDYPQLLKPQTIDAEEGNIKLYPNPFNSEVNIEFNSGEEIRSVEIYTVQGDLAGRFDNGFSKNISWAPENLIPGIYVFKFQLKDRIIFKKAIYSPDR